VAILEENNDLLRIVIFFIAALAVVQTNGAYVGIKLSTER